MHLRTDDRLMAFKAPLCGGLTLCKVIILLARRPARISKKINILLYVSEKMRADRNLLSPSHRKQSCQTIKIMNEDVSQSVNIEMQLTDTMEQIYFAKSISIGSIAFIGDQSENISNEGRGKCTCQRRGDESWKIEGTDAGQRSGNETRGLEIWGRVGRCDVGEYVKRRKALENFVRELDVACRLSRESLLESGRGRAWIRSKVKLTSIHHVWIIRPAFRLSPRLLAKFMCRRSLRSPPTLSTNSSSFCTSVSASEPRETCDYRWRINHSL